KRLLRSISSARDATSASANERTAWRSISMSSPRPKSKSRTVVPSAACLDAAGADIVRQSEDPSNVDDATPPPCSPVRETRSLRAAGAPAGLWPGGGRHRAEDPRPQLAPGRSAAHRDGTRQPVRGEPLDGPRGAAAPRERRPGGP